MQLIDNFKNKINIGHIRIKVKISRILIQHTVVSPVTLSKLECMWKSKQTSTAKIKKFLSNLMRETRCSALLNVKYKNKSPTKLKLAKVQTDLLQFIIEI